MVRKRNLFTGLLWLIAIHPDGRFIERVGFYDPLKEPVEISLDREKVKDWYKKG